MGIALSPSPSSVFGSLVYECCEIPETVMASSGFTIMLAPAPLSTYWEHTAVGVRMPKGGGVEAKPEPSGCPLHVLISILVYVWAISLW